MRPAELPRGIVRATTDEQVLRAREMLDEGASMAAAARELGVTRSALNRGLERMHLTNHEVMSQVTTMKLEAATMQAELESLRAWRDMMLASAPSAAGERRRPREQPQEAAGGGTVTAPSLHHRALRLVCPDGHITSTQAASGNQVRCSGCQLLGTTVLLTVPERADDQLVDETTLGRPPVRCRICQKPGEPGGRTPVGWITIQIQVDPAADPKGRSQRILWPYCGPDLRDRRTGEGQRPGAQAPPGRVHVARLTDARAAGRPVRGVGGGPNMNNSFRLSCVRCGQSIQHVPPTADSGGSYLDWVFACSDCKAALRGLIGHETSPGRPARSAHEQRVERIRALHHRGRSSSQAPAAPTNAGQRTA